MAREATPLRREDGTLVRTLVDLQRMAPFLAIRSRVENGRSEIVFADPRYVSGEAVLFTVSPDDLFDADGNRFVDDLP